MISSEMSNAIAAPTATEPPAADASLSNTRFTSPFALIFTSFAFTICVLPFAKFCKNLGEIVALVLLFAIKNDTHGVIEVPAAEPATEDISEFNACVALTLISPILPSFST